MPNIVRDIVDQLGTQIGTVLPSRTLSRYNWSLESNSYRTNKDLFGIRVGSASTTNGTNKTVTMNHTVDVVLSSEFKNVGDNDAALQEAIMKLHDDAETLYVYAFYRHFEIQRVLLVNAIDLSSPEIDNDNNIVSVTVSFGITYRTGA